MTSAPDQKRPGPPAATEDGATLKRVLLTVLIIGGAVVFMVLPWVMLFHSPEQYAAWAATGVVMAVAVHLFLARRRRRQELEAMVEEEGGVDEDPGPP